jgi:hypothetical protein
MGGVNYNDGSRMFLSVSEGKIRNKKLNVAYDAFTGFLESIDLKDDEYEGKKFRKVVLTMRDDENPQSVAIIQFMIDSWCSQNFFARISKADLSKPMLFGVTSSDESKATFSYLKQGTEILKKDPDFPRPKPVTVSGKTLSDWTEPIEKIEGMVAKLQELLKTVEHVPSDVAPAGEAKPVKDDDLPF